jgi:hypothetical protein
MGMKSTDAPLVKVFYGSADPGIAHSVADNRNDKF